MYRTPLRPNSSLHLLKTSPKLYHSARVILDLAAHQPGKAMSLTDVARQAGVSPEQGKKDVRALYEESERLGVVSFFGWDTDRRTGEPSFTMTSEAASMWISV